LSSAPKNLRNFLSDNFLSDKLVDLSIPARLTLLSHLLLIIWEILIFHEADGWIIRAFVEFSRSQWIIAPFAW